MFRIDRAEPGEWAAEWVTGSLGGDARGELPGERHDEMAARDERFLVGSCDDLSGGEGRYDGPEAHDAAGADDDEIHVGAGGELGQGIRSAVPARTERQV